MLEPHLNHTIKITLPDGRLIWDKQLAVTPWHAIDKSYAKYSHLQADRKEYTRVKPMIRAN